MLTQELSSIPRSGLVGEYLLDGNTNDTNDGTKTNGTLTNGAYASCPVGYVKQWCDLTGNGYLDVGDRWGGSGSISIYVALVSDVAATSGDYDVIYRYSDSSGFDSMRVYYGGYGNNQLQWKYSTNTPTDANNTFTISQTFVAGQNYLMEFELDDTAKKARFYLNGQLHSEQTFTGSISKCDKASQKLSFGNRWYNPNEGWDGRMGGIRLLNYVQTADERLRFWHEFNRKLGGGSDFGAVIPAPKYYWDMLGNTWNDVASQLDFTPGGTPASATDKFGIARGFTFSGDDYASAAPVTTTTGSLAIGFKTSSTGTAQRLWNNANCAITLNPSSNNGALSFDDFVADTITTSGTAYNDGNPHIVVCTSDDTASDSLYVDGVSQASGRVGATIGSGTSNLGRRTNGTQYYTGDFQFVAIWDVKLTAAQVAYFTNVMNSGRYPYAFRRSIPANIRSKLRLHYAGYQSGTTVYDMSGSGNNGTSVGSPTIARSQQNPCLLFNGSSRYVDGPTFDPGNDYAVSCWFKPTTTASEQVFFSNVQGSGGTLQGFFFLYDSSNKLRLTEYMPSFSNRDLYTGTLTLAADKWYFCTGVIRGGTVYEIYLNDHLEATQTGTDKTSYNQASRFGSFSHAAASYITGPSECFVWNTSPSQQEIQQLYYATYRN